MVTGSASSEDPVVRRMAVILMAASWNGTDVRLSDLPKLLPDDGPSSSLEVEKWVSEHPEAGSLHGLSVGPPGSTPPLSAESESRRQRGESYLAAAQQLWTGPLAVSLPLTRCVGVTGSTAYLEPAEGDDLDFMVITRESTAWLFLLSTFAMLRFSSGASPPYRSEWCFNYVLEESGAKQEFRSPRGFLFAREALTARILSGEAFYHGLLDDAKWMADELPRMYGLREGSRPAAGAPCPDTPLALRVLNALVFPVLAAFLQLKAIHRNARYRREGRLDELFRAETRLGRYALYSEKFHRLSELCAPGESIQSSGVERWASTARRNES